jgi:catechol 2,3-dioxygenase-like lactoylglutathione lyase family enzyme
VSTRVGVSHVAVVTADLDGFRTFYEETIGLETTIVFGAGPGHARQAVIVAGNVMLHVFEVYGYDAAPHGSTPAMFERGRLDHIGFTVADEAALIAMRDRLLAADASSGTIRRLGPMLSVRFQDPEGFEGEVNCFDPTYDPSTVRDGDEIVDPNWLERTKRVLTARDDLPHSPGASNDCTSDQTARIRALPPL